MLPSTLTPPSPISKVDLKTFFKHEGNYQGLFELCLSRGLQRAPSWDMPKWSRLVTRELGARRLYRLDRVMSHHPWRRASTLPLQPHLDISAIFISLQQDSMLLQPFPDLLQRHNQEKPAQ
ncbi:predicted protein [Histoplasma capsulatum var. duboisii H88]|uniref:Predicted protein n=2 Tax=Ajellomyces capsulatus TaxID=5037 RepID=F0UU55_AJEC8|nr:predicted protein [Histoplasma capsulatum H143]EGC49432.1 predicted protein [Histoplasma capsulatum var. duboisii H88]